MRTENRTILKDADGFELVIAEQTTVRITGTLVDETGAAVPSAALTTLTLTIYARDHATQAIVNSVDDVNILNSGRGTVHATSGLLTLLLDPADQTIIDATLDQEWHRALIEGTYSATKKLKYEIDFPVRNLNKIT